MDKTKKNTDMLGKLIEAIAAVIAVIWSIFVKFKQPA